MVDERRFNPAKTEDSVPGSPKFSGNARQEVKNIMSKTVVSISSNETVVSAAKIMSENGISCVAIVDNDSVAGILSQTDFVKLALEEHKEFYKTKVANIMSSPVISIPPDCTVSQANKMMGEKRIKRVVILDEERLVGIVSIGDLVKSIIADQKFTIEQLEHYIHG